MKIYLAGHIEKENREDVYSLSQQLNISFNRINSFFYKRESEEEIEFKKKTEGRKPSLCNSTKKKLKKS